MKSIRVHVPGLITGLYVNVPILLQTSPEALWSLDIPQIITLVHFLNDGILIRLVSHNW